MAKYVVVDSNNRWLFCGEAETPEEARSCAKEASFYDDEATVYVYEVCGQHEFPPAS